MKRQQVKNGFYQKVIQQYNKKEYREINFVLFVSGVSSKIFKKKEVKIMLDLITANEIVNVLQSKGNFNSLKWAEKGYLNTFITMDLLVNVTIQNVEYCVIPFILFKRRYRTMESFPYKAYVLGFVYEGSVYEIGKYTRRVSEMFTSLCNYYFANNKYERVYFAKCK